MAGEEVDIDKEVDKVDNTEEKKQVGGDESGNEGEGVDGEVEVKI